MIPILTSCDDCGAEPGEECHWACSTRWPDTEPDPKPDTELDDPAVPDTSAA